MLMVTVSKMLVMVMLTNRVEEYCVGNDSDVDDDIDSGQPPPTRSGE